MGQLAEEIYRQVQTLPFPLEKEVLHYIEYLKLKYAEEADVQNLQNAQATSINALWDNEDDQIWDQI